MVSAYQGYIACQDIFSSGGPFSVADGMDLLQNPRDLSYDSLLEIARDSRFFCTVSTSTTMGSAKPCGPQNRTTYTTTCSHCTAHSCSTQNKKLPISPNEWSQNNLPKYRLCCLENLNSPTKYSASFLLVEVQGAMNCSLLWMRCPGLP